MAGDCDFLLRVLAKDLDDYRRFQIEHLGRIRGVRNIKTDIPTQKVKQSTELPVRQSGLPLAGSAGLPTAAGS